MASGRAVLAFRSWRGLRPRLFQGGGLGGEPWHFRPDHAGDPVVELTVPGVTPLEGGLSLVVEGRIVGGIGVSRVLSSHASEVAQAGVSALEEGT